MAYITNAINSYDTVSTRRGYVISSISMRCYVILSDRPSHLSRHAIVDTVCHMSLGRYVNARRAVEKVEEKEVLEEEKSLDI